MSGVFSLRSNLMFHRFTPKKTALVLVTLLAIGICVLAGPVANWLQMRERVIPTEEQVDVLYLVCGARSQHRRLYAMLEYLAGLPDENGLPLLLVGNDAENSLWSRSKQRNLTRAEWAVEHLRKALEDDAAISPVIILVPGDFHGTDGEMEALAAFLASAPEIDSLGLVTSPFHARRTVSRLRKYNSSETRIYLVPFEAGWIDRNPVRVLSELLKMLRDSAGLSRTPGLSRRRRSSDETADRSLQSDYER